MSIRLITNPNDAIFKRVNIMIYGRSGAGKTRFCGTAPNVLFVSAEGGEKTIRQNVGKNATIALIENFNDILDIANKLQLGEYKYDSIALDSLTDIQEQCMQYICEKEGVEKPRIQDWGTLNVRMMNMIKFFRDLKHVNLIVTALEVDEKNDAGNSTGKMIPALQGKIQNTIAGYFDEVYYLNTWGKRVTNEETGKEEDIIIRKLCTRPVAIKTETNSTRTFIAKSRADIKETYIDPDFRVIEELIMKEVLHEESGSKEPVRTKTGTSD